MRPTARKRLRETLARESRARRTLKHYIVEISAKALIIRPAGVRRGDSPEMTVPWGELYVTALKRKLKAEAASRSAVERTIRKHGWPGLR